MILMSRNNPDGMKLEDVLLQLIDEINQKSEFIKDSPHAMRDEIIASNNFIISKLQEARKSQMEIYAKLDSTEPNRGPKNPRL